MKNNLEKNIKDSLDGFEMPYDASAWTSLSNKLDQVMPTTPTKPSNLKWYLGGAAAIAVIVTGALLLNRSEEKDTQNVAVNTSVDNTTSEQPVTENGQPNKTINKDLTLHEELEGNQSIETPSNNAGTSSTGTATETNTQNNNNQVTTLPNKNSQGNLGNGGDNRDRIVPTTPVGSKVIIPTVSNVCMGESVTINNTNDVDLVISGPNYKTVIPANKKKSFTPENEGSYRVSYIQDGTSKTESLFSVLEVPAAEIVMNDVEDNGIPTIEFSTPSTGSKYSWDLGNKSGSYTGNEVTAHYIAKDDYTVTLKVTGTNGCISTATKKVSVESDYNLYAADAIQTSDPDALRNSFMPEALRVRNVDFNMIIIEPSTGSIIFETSDATNRWTGVDKRTGQYVDVNKAYIWKVNLKNPERGEKSEYRGTVIRVQ